METSLGEEALLAVDWKRKFKVTRLNKLLGIWTHRLQGVLIRDLDWMVKAKICSHWDDSVSIIKADKHKAKLQNHLNSWKAAHWDRDSNNSTSPKLLIETNWLRFKDFWLHGKLNVLHLSPFPTPRSFVARPSESFLASRPCVELCFGLFFASSAFFPLLNYS